MESVLRIISTVSAPWVPWILLLLLVLLVLAEMFQFGTVTRCFTQLFTTAERNYSDASSSPLSRLLLLCYRMGTFSMVFYLFFRSSEECRIEDWVMVLLLIVVVELVKWCVLWLMDYTFRIRRRFAPVYAHYSQTWTVAAIVLWVVMLVMLKVDMPLLSQWVVIGVASVALTVMLIKWIRVFFTDIRSIIYVVMYLLTLELLPILGIGFWVNSYL